MKNRWNPSHDVHIPKAEPRRSRNRVFDKAGLVRNASHALAGCVKFLPARIVVRFEQVIGILTNVDPHTKRCCNTVGRDVIMRWPDAARGKDRTVCLAQSIDRRDDRLAVIRDDADFF